jgi:hypothetical protein
MNKKDDDKFTIWHWIGLIVGLILVVFHILVMNGHDGWWNYLLAFLSPRKWDLYIDYSKKGW